MKLEYVCNCKEDGLKRVYLHKEGLKHTYFYRCHKCNYNLKITLEKEEK